MALNLPSSSSTGQRVSSSDAAAWPMTGSGTIFLKFKPNWNSTDLVDHVLFENGYQLATTFRFFRMEKFSDNNVYMGFDDFSLGDFRVTGAATSAMFTNGTWVNHSLIWSTSTGTTYYTDNTSQYSNASLTISAFSQGTTNVRETFGDSFQNGVAGVAYSTGSQADGAFAEYARWNRVLTSAERALLQLQYSPLWFPSGLLEYRPFADYTGTHLLASEGPDLTVNAFGNTIIASPVVTMPPCNGLLGVTV